jgi:hypothetical protein
VHTLIGHFPRDAIDRDIDVAIKQLRVEIVRVGIADFDLHSGMTPMHRADQVDQHRWRDGAHHTKAKAGPFGKGEIARGAADGVRSVIDLP